MASRKPFDPSRVPQAPVSESVPGEWDERSIEVDLDVVHQRSVDRVPADLRKLSGERSLADLWPHQREATVEYAKDIILFDPMGFDLGAMLTQRGFAFRVASSGVDVMGLIAARPTGAVLCGPSEDAERRRLLTAAVKVRFPDIPVIYASTHAKNPDAVAGAKREGALDVIPIPLPSGDLFDAFLLPFVQKSVPQKAAHPSTVSNASSSVATDFDDASLPNTVSIVNAQTSEGISLDSFDDFEDAKTDAMDVEVLQEIKRDGAEHEASVVRPKEQIDGRGRWSFPPGAAVHPPVHPAPGAPAAGDASEKESDSLVAAASALGPFLWGLDDALAWTEQKAREGHHDAVTHARTLSSIRQILKAMAKNEERSR